MLVAAHELYGWGNYFRETTELLIKQKSIKHAGFGTTTSIDIVKDVINLLPVYWIAEEVVRRPTSTKQDDIS